MIGIRNILEAVRGAAIKKKRHRVHWTRTSHDAVRVFATGQTAIWQISGTVWRVREVLRVMGRGSDNDDSRWSL